MIVTISSNNHIAKPVVFGRREYDEFDGSLAAKLFGFLLGKY
jgi:hypothetical protein